MWTKDLSREKSSSSGASRYGDMKVVMILVAGTSILYIWKVSFIVTMKFSYANILCLGVCFL